MTNQEYVLLAERLIFLGFAIVFTVGGGLLGIKAGTAIAKRLERRG